MAFAIPTEFVALERTIHGSRAAMLEGYIHLIRRLDEQPHWALIVGKAKEAGLQKEELCCELSLLLVDHHTLDGGADHAGPLRASQDQGQADRDARGAAGGRRCFARKGASSPDLMPLPGSGLAKHPVIPNSELLRDLSL